MSAYNESSAEDISGVLIAILLISSVIVFLLMAYFTYISAKRLGIGSSWMAWIPILNIYLMTKIAGKRDSEFWMAFIGGLFCGIVLFAFEITWWMEIAKRLSKPSWFGIFAPVPFIGLPFMAIIAFGTPNYQYLYSLWYYQQYPYQYYQPHAYYQPQNQQSYPYYQYPPQQQPHIQQTPYYPIQPPIGQASPDTSYQSAAEPGKSVGYRHSFCPQCGAASEEGENFCEKCGSALFEP